MVVVVFVCYFTWLGCAHTNTQFIEMRCGGQLTESMRWISTACWNKRIVCSCDALISNRLNGHLNRYHCNPFVHVTLKTMHSSYASFVFICQNTNWFQNGATLVLNCLILSLYEWARWRDEYKRNAVVIHSSVSSNVNDINFSNLSHHCDVIKFY